MAKKDNNAMNYIKLAIMRNMKFEETNIDYCNNNGMSWETLNAERVSIENGLITGLENMGANNRATVFSGITDMRTYVEATAYSTSIDQNIGDEDKFKTLRTCKRIKEAVDYLETIMQIHFPTEFPNEFVANVLFGKNNEEVEQGFEIVEQLSDVAAQPVTDVTSILETENSDNLNLLSQQISHPDLIDGMDPGLAQFLYDEKKTLTKDFTEVPEGFIATPETMLINGMDPGLFSTLLKSREARVSSNAENFQATQILEE